MLDALGIARAAFVGTSLGGWLALDYATRRPERVDRLALLCPGGVGRQKRGWLFRALLLRPSGPGACAGRPGPSRAWTGPSTGPSSTNSC